MVVWKHKPNTPLSFRTILDIAQVDSSQDLRTIILQKEEFRNCKARLIKR